jgi:hypothetical protein
MVSSSLLFWPTGLLEADDLSEAAKAVWRMQRQQKRSTKYEVERGFVILDSVYACFLKQDSTVPEGPELEQVWIKCI